MGPLFCNCLHHHSLTDDKMPHPEITEDALAILLTCNDKNQHNIASKSGSNHAQKGQPTKCCKCGKEVHIKKNSPKMCKMALTMMTKLMMMWTSGEIKTVNSSP